MLSRSQIGYSKLAFVILPVSIDYNDNHSNGIPNDRFSVEFLRGLYYLSTKTLHTFALSTIS